MKYRTEKRIIGDNGETFEIGDEVSVTYNKESGYEGGGFGGATITKITDTGFQYTHGRKRVRSVQYKNIREIWAMKRKNAEEQPRQLWIPVAERLPEPGIYLVSCDDKMNPVKRMRMKGICFYDHNGIYDGRVYAWMPLPKPYKEEGAE